MSNLRLPLHFDALTALTAYDAALQNPNTRPKPAQLTEVGIAAVEARDRRPDNLVYLKPRLRAVS